MRNKLVLLSLFLLLAAFSASAQTYDEMLAKVKTGDTSIDFQALRFAFAADPAASSVALDPKSRSAMIKAMNEKNFKEALKLAEETHKTHFVDMGSHIIASLAYKGLGDAKKSKWHESIYVGLVNSVLKSGDGNSAKTAYVVISITEEVVVLSALELKRGTQASVEEDGRKCDVLTVTDSTGASSKVYFNVDKIDKGAGKVAKP